MDAYVFLGSHFHTPTKERTMFKFEMFDRLKDQVSGFTGVVLGRTEYSTGCKHYGLAAEAVNKEGTVPDWQWFDETRLLKVGQKTIEATTAVQSKRGGPSPNPPQM